MEGGPPTTVWLTRFGLALVSAWSSLVDSSEYLNWLE